MVDYNRKQSSLASSSIAQRRNVSNSVNIPVLSFSPLKLTAKFK
jgi:hypothetical protein